MIRIYGIKNCSTMKKAFTWLTEHNIAYDFHDYKKSGIHTEKLSRWCEQVGWQALINTRGTTWRGLSSEEQAINTTDAAVQLMHTHTSLIRRPILETASGQLLIGFDPEIYTKNL